jgi:phosphate-selective porin OprO and OprP
MAVKWETCMSRSYERFRRVLVLCGVAFAALGAYPALAQQAEPAHAPDDGPPALPAASTPAVPPTPREAQLEERIRQLELMVDRLQRQVGAMETNGSASSQPDNVTPNGALEGSGLPPSQPGVTPVPGAVETGDLPRASVSPSGGIGVPGGSFPPVPRPADRFDSPATLEDKRARVRFGPGFELITEDSEFILQFHDLTQIDYRGYLQGGQETIHDTFAIPRQRWIFSGHITKEIGFMASLQQGFDSVAGLDMFLDLNYDRRLQFRMGRFKTPFTYEFFIEPIQGLITPERSLFFNNFGQNRDVGLMAYGQLLNGPNFDEVSRIQYAAGIFNGNRNGFLANQDGKFLSAYVNAHPFGEWTDSLLENFNIGGSVFTGTNAQPAVPSTFRTVVPTTGNPILGIPFLTLNPDFRLQGPMAFWDLHTAWFYRPLALIAEWQSGYQDYANTLSAGSLTQHIRVPVESFYVTAAYLLTGETRSSVGIVKPKHPFTLRRGESGLGAWEIFGRYNYMDIGSSIYSSGLADTTGNANRLWMTDLGINWHITQYVKMVFDWNHAEFNNPVTYAVGKYQTTANTFWWRVQLFF